MVGPKVNAQANLFEQGQTGSYASLSYTEYENTNGIAISLAGVSMGGTSFGLLLGKIQEGSNDYYLYGAQITYRPPKTDVTSRYGSEIGFSFVRNGEYNVNSFGINAMVYGEKKLEKSLIQPFVGISLAYNSQKREYDTSVKFTKGFNGGAMFVLKRKAKTSAVLTPVFGYSFDTKETYFGIELGIVTKSK